MEHCCGNQRGGGVVQIKCEHCGEMVKANPRNKQQRYCGKKACQRARKTAWEKEKIKTDPDYRMNRKESAKKWADEHSDYWKAYRKRNPHSVQRNRLLQRVRNRRYKETKRQPTQEAADKNIAKMDASKHTHTRLSGTFWLVPNVAKMDALMVHIVDINDEKLKPEVVLSDCKQGLDCLAHQILFRMP